MGTVDLHAQRFQAQVLDIADDADRHDGDLGVEGLGLAAGLHGDRDAVLALGEAVHLGGHTKLHPPALEGLLRRRRDVRVLHRHDPVQHLNHRHLGAQGPVEAGELDTDSP